MKTKRRRNCIAILMSAFLATGFCVQHNITTTYAENTTQQDTINTSITSGADAIEIALSGNITSNSWWYMTKEMTVNYENGATKTMRCIVQAGSQSASISVDWQAVDATFTYGAIDQNTGLLNLTYQINKSALIGASSITVDGQTFSLSASTEPELPQETETPEQTPTPVPEETPSIPETTPDTGDVTPNLSGKITIDGAVKDWKNVSALLSNDSAITSWKMVKDTSGNLYVEFEGNAVSEWYGDYLWKTFSITQNGNTNTQQINNIENKAYVNEAHGNSAAPYYVEFCIPAEQLSGEYTITFAGTTIDSASIGILDGVNSAPDDDNTYHGIVIDGRFDDWNAVKKYDAVCPNPEHPNCLESTAMVFDGDYVYVYIKDGASGNAGGAGTHSNGKWDISTDLGRHLVLTLHPDGTVTSKAEGIQSVHVGAQWEIAIPASQLPNYKNTINWGLYGPDDNSLEPFVKDVSNLNGSLGTAGEEAPIVIDGQYGDWDNYPYTYYEYATNGTQEDVLDSHTAITSKGKMLYQYVTTDMPAHMQEAGGEFSQAITIKLNHNEAYEFYPRLVAVDSEGNINWDPQLSNLPAGTYKFELVDTKGWSNAPTLSELQKYGNNHYGTMIMTIGENGRDSCEFELNLEKVAQKFGMSADEISLVESQFGRIGQQWASCSGATSGPLVGVGLSIATVCGVLFLQKRRIL